MSENLANQASACLKNNLFKPHSVVISFTFTHCQGQVFQRDQNNFFVSKAKLGVKTEQLVKVNLMLQSTFYFPYILMATLGTGMFDEEDCKFPNCL